MPFVLDASVAMSWCFEDEGTPQTERVLDSLADDNAVVPGLWILEVGNVLMAAERRDRLTEAQSSRFIGLLGQLPIVADRSEPDLRNIVATARAHGLSAYDASYLDLAERRGLEVATLDAKLSAACRSAGVGLLIT